MSKRGCYGLCDPRRPIESEFYGTEPDVRMLVARTQVVILVRHMEMCIQTNPSETYYSTNMLLRNAHYALRMALSAHRHAQPLAPSRANPVRLVQAQARQNLVHAENAVANNMLLAGIAAVDRAYRDYFVGGSDYTFTVETVTST